MNMKYFIYYLLIINIIGFIIVLYDKKMAIKNNYRVSEKILFFVANIGGCYGFIISMYLFHHKTKKLKFKLLIPIICILWLVIILGVISI